MSGLESTASCVLGPDLDVLYVVAHAEKMRTDLLGIIQVQAENCQIWRGHSQYTFHVTSLRECRAGQIFFTLRKHEESSHDPSCRVPIT